MKTCSKCGQEKPFSEFHKDAQRGYKPACKACRKAESAARYAENTERLRAEQARKYRENPEKRNAATAAWRERNAEKVKATRAAYRAAHTEQRKEYNARWAEENADRKRAAEKAWRQENPERDRQRHAAYRERHPEKHRTRFGEMAGSQPGQEPRSHRRLPSPAPRAAARQRGQPPRQKAGCRRHAHPGRHHGPVPPPARQVRLLPRQHQARLPCRSHPAPGPRRFQRQGQPPTALSDLQHPEVGQAPHRLHALAWPAAVGEQVGKFAYHRSNLTGTIASIEIPGHNSRIAAQQRRGIAVPETRRMIRHSSLVAIFSSAAWRSLMGGPCGRASALPVPCSGTATCTVPPTPIAVGEAVYYRNKEVSHDPLPAHVCATVSSRPSLTRRSGILRAHPAKRRSTAAPFRRGVQLAGRAVPVH